MIDWGKLWLFMAGLLALLAVWATLDRISQRHYQEWMAEKTGMETLGRIGREMIYDGGKDVRADEVMYIISFRAFCDYVAKRHPKIVVCPDAPNPFPGILPGKYYIRLSGVARNSSDILLASDFYQVSWGTVRFALGCDSVPGPRSKDEVGLSTTAPASRF